MPEKRQPIPLMHPIGTRDGTLAKDAKMVNCYPEQAEEGTGVVKRPGMTLVRQNTAGTAQGQFRVNGVPWSVSGDVAYNTVTGTAVAIPSVTVSGQWYSTLSDKPLGVALLKSASGLWKFDGTTFTKVTADAYPAATVPGIALLDGTYYVMDSTGTVYGSDLEDPLTWPALNFLGVDAGLGQGVALHRHLNYIVAFCTEGTEFFYDAANATASPLSPVTNASWRTGAAGENTVVRVGDDSFVVSKGDARGRQVIQISGLQLSVVSHPYIERVLNQSTLVGALAFSVRVDGHNFYVLNLVDLGVTLVYDVTTQFWHSWTSTVSGVEGGFVGVGSISSATVDYIQDASTGAVYSMSPDVFQDNGNDIAVLIRTNPKNFQTLNTKFFPALYLMADTVDSIVSVRWSDDDYQSFSTWKTIDISVENKMLQRCGSSRRRSWDVLHADNVRFRAYSMETEIVMGA